MDSPAWPNASTIPKYVQLSVECHSLHPMPCSYYVDLISKEGLIGIVLAQSPEFVAPHGAKQPIFGTNPIGISIPAQVRGSRGPRLHAMHTWRRTGWRVQQLRNRAVPRLAHAE